MSCLASRLNSPSVAGSAPQRLPHRRRPPQSPVTQWPRPVEPNEQPVLPQTRASQWAGSTTLTRPPGGNRQPVAARTCFGSFATAGQIVRVVRLTRVSSRSPAPRFGVGVGAVRGFGDADLADRAGGGRFVGRGAALGGVAGAPA